MKIDYQNILKKNMINVLKDILREIKKNDNKAIYQLYITFTTTHKELKIPAWLKKKYPDEMTIVIEHEYWDLRIFDDNFKIILSFNDIKVNLSIPFKSVISFADANAKFGLKIQENKIKKSSIKINKNTNEKNNVIDFSKFKKSN